MKRTRIKQVLQSGKPGEVVTVCGWIRSTRISKNVAFIVISDGSSQDTLQAIVDADQQAFAAVENCHTGASVRLRGELRESPGKGQRVELGVSELDVIGACDPERYPLQKKRHSLEFLREIGHLRPRTNTFGAVLRVRNQLAARVHEFFQERGFLWIHTPIITGSDCEGAGEMFAVTTLPLVSPPSIPTVEKGGTNFDEDFFGKPAYLTVSGQLQAEFVACAMGDVYTFGPTFRAENSNTSRHLAEFWMIEPEIAFADLSDNADLAQDFLQDLCRSVVTRCPDEMAFFAKFYKSFDPEDLMKLAESEFIRISYTDAVSEIGKAKRDFEFPVSWGSDLQAEHERYLTDEVFKSPVIVTDYPKSIKPFYMRVNDDDKTVAAMDVLVPRVGEIMGGSQREERIDRLDLRVRECDVPADEMTWYRELREWGSCPHAGFGAGFDRLVQYLTGMANIRDVIPCPRVPQTIEF